MSAMLMDFSSWQRPPNTRTTSTDPDLRRITLDPYELITNCNVLPWPRWVLDRVGFFKSYIEKFWVLKSFKNEKTWENMGKPGKTWENMRKHGKKRNFEKKKFGIRKLNRTRSRHPHVCFLFKSTVCSWNELHEIEIFDVLWLIIPYAYAKLTNPQYKHGMVYVQIQIYVLTNKYNIL